MYQWKSQLYMILIVPDDRITLPGTVGKPHDQCYCQTLVTLGLCVFYHIGSFASSCTVRQPFEILSSLASLKLIHHQLLEPLSLFFFN